MKKFISLLVAVATSVLVTCCREAEDLTALPETSKNTISNLKKDSLNKSIEIPPTNNSNADVEEKDPPPKDEIKW